MNLSNEMNRLVERARRLIIDGAADAQRDPHHWLCCLLSDEFDLWRDDKAGIKAFPIWLSRVVEGEMRDAPGDDLNDDGDGTEIVRPPGRR